MRISRSGVLVSALVLLCLGIVAWATSRATLVDLAVYRAGAGAVLDGRSLYDAHPPGSILPFTYPPFAAIALVPLAWLPQKPAEALFTLASLLALVRVCAVLLTVSGRGRFGGARPAQLLVVYVVAALCSEPVARNLAYGQVNLILMWLVVEDVLGLGARTPRTQGLLVGIAAGIKLVPASFALLFLVVGRVRAAVLAGAAFLATVAAGFLLQPSASHEYWTGLLFDPSRVGDIGAVVNQSLLGLLTRTLPDGLVRASWIVLALATFALCLTLARWYWRRGLRVVALALVATAGLLCSPISWSHHWVWFVVLLGACGQLWSLRRVRVLAALLVAAPLSWVVWWESLSRSGPTTGPVSFVLVNAYVLVGLAFVVVLWWVRQDVGTNDASRVELEMDGRPGRGPDQRDEAAPTL